MNTRHKHYNEIIAWAEGKKIQVFLYGKWEDKDTPMFHPDLQYRVKPEAITIRLYRTSSGLITMRIEDDMNYNWSNQGLVCISDPITIELKA